jgi:hypothetical protein
MNKIDIADLDCVYLSYDEPNKEEHWVKIKNMVPWAVRVDGVKGSDAAHKAAADASTTDRFILIDGDNLPDEEFFNQQLTFDETTENNVLRWKARNNTNGLLYGNGGLSCWTKDFIYNMRTHEASDGSDDTNVEFCFDPNYISMYDTYSTTYINSTPYQAWRAGFREGVKMCLNRGVRPTIAGFKEQAHKRNLDHLTIWHNVGRDVENGIWSMLGARMGTYMTMITPTWDYTEVRDFDSLKLIYDTVAGDNPEHISARIAPDLNTQLDLPIVMLDEKASAFFKYHYQSKHKNKDIMLSEMAVIRQQEGW